MNRHILRVVIAAIVVMGAVVSRAAYAGEETVRKVLFFFSPSCHYCSIIKADVVPAIEKEFAGKVVFEYHDTTDPEQYRLLLSLRDRYAPDAALNVPLMIVAGHWMSGRIAIERDLRTFLSESFPPDSGGQDKPAASASVDLMERFKTIRPLAIAGAGLADGINPCAFTVIVFFISFLALQGYRRRDLVFIGLAFITAVFLTYLLIGFGLFNFLYRLKGFLLLTRLLNGAVGIFSIALGIFSLYDVFKFRASGSTDGLILQLPQAVKNRIHAVIGRFYRVKQRDPGAPRPNVLYLAASALVTGFLVSLLEAVCTGQLYLPTVIFVFKTSTLKIQAFEYLVLYNLMFVTPLILVFILALFGTTSQQFGAFLRRHLVTVKVALAVVFFALGIFLLWR